MYKDSYVNIDYYAILHNLLICKIGAVLYKRSRERLQLYGYNLDLMHKLRLSSRWLSKV